MMKIEVDKIIHSRRKTVGLIITEEARLIVRAPYGISKSRIMEIVQKKQDWIEKKQTEIKNRNRLSPTKEFREGEILYYLGKPYKLRYKDNYKASISFQEFPDENLVYINNFYRERKTSLLELLIEFYREKTREEIYKRIEKLSQLYGLHYRRVKISRANKRLGSCSSLGNINFSWRLSMAPPQIIDYIVIHELAHLKEQNHSRKFWKLVEQMLPNYKTFRKWIRKNYYLLKLTPNI